MAFKDPERKKQYDVAHQKATYYSVNIRIRRDSDTFRGLMDCEKATGLPCATYAQVALNEKLQKDGWLPAKNLVEILQNGSHEYGISIIGYVAYVLENRRIAEEKDPNIGHMNAVQAVEEDYILRHPEYYADGKIMFPNDLELVDGVDLSAFATK